MALSVFNHAVGEANLWVNEVASQLEIDDRETALRALRGVLHALRDRLTVDLAAKFSAQLPLLIRGLFFEGWNPHPKPVRDVTLTDFAIDLQTTLGPYPSPYDVEAVARAVFAAIGAHLSEGEWDKIARVLPRELSTLWVLSGA